MHRWRSLLCLAIAAGMLHWGDAILRPALRGWLGIAYWGGCLALSISAVIFGIRDIRAVLQSIRLERATLMRRAYRELRTRRGSPIQPQPETAASSRKADSTSQR